jgi:hypothetical protein
VNNSRRRRRMNLKQKPAPGKDAGRPHALKIFAPDATFPLNAGLSRARFSPFCGAGVRSVRGPIGEMGDPGPASHPSPPGEIRWPESNWLRAAQLVFLPQSGCLSPNFVDLPLTCLTTGASFQGKRLRLF